MEQDKRFSRVLTISVLTFIALVSVVLAIYYASTYRGIGQTVNNRDDKISELSEEDIKLFEDVLKGYLSFYGRTEREIADTKFVVREGSLKISVEEYDGAKFANFLVDVSEPKLTYEVSMELGGSDEDVYVTCPIVQLMQDPSIFCVGSNLDSTIDTELGSYLPYETMPGAEVSMSIYQNVNEGSGMPELNIYVGACENGEDGKRAREAVNEWISARSKVDPNIIPKTFNYVECD